MEEFVVFTEQVAQELIDRGFNLIDCINGIWFFEDSLLLEEEIEKILGKIS